MDNIDLPLINNTNYLQFLIEINFFNDIIKMSYKDRKGCDAIEKTNQKVFAHILDTILSYLYTQNRIDTYTI